MLSEELKQDIIDFYKNLDCTYIILKVEDLVNTFIDYHDYKEFMYFLKRYNVYRKTAGKKVNKYFVVNRDDVPYFQTAKEFFNYLESNGVLYQKGMDTKSKLENS